MLGQLVLSLRLSLVEGTMPTWVTSVPASRFYEEHRVLVDLSAVGQTSASMNHCLVALHFSGVVVI